MLVFFISGSGRLVVFLYNGYCILLFFFFEVVLCYLIKNVYSVWNVI